MGELEDAARETVRALGLSDGIAYPQLLVSADGVRLIEAAARVPGGQMSELVRHAIDVDLVEVALRQALGQEISDDMVAPRLRQPLAIHFLTACPGSLRPGRLLRVGSLEPLLQLPGVVQAETYFTPGETIRPVQVDGDRRGYVIAYGETREQALERAQQAAAALDVDVEIEEAAPQTELGSERL